MSTVDPSVSVADPTLVQVLPFADCDAVITLPWRTIFTHVGRGALVPVMFAAEAPVLLRVLNVVPFAADTIMNP